MRPGTMFTPIRRHPTRTTEGSLTPGGVSGALGGAAPIELLELEPLRRLSAMHEQLAKTKQRLRDRVRELMPLVNST